MYGIIVKESYTTDYGDRYESPTVVYYNKLLEFETEDLMRDWISNNDKTLYGKKEYRVIQFDELVVERTVTFSFK